MDFSFKNIFKIFIVIIVIFLVALMVVYVFKKAKDAWTGDSDKFNREVKIKQMDHKYKVVDSAQDTLNKGFSYGVTTFADNTRELTKNLPQTMDSMGRFVNTINGEGQQRYPQQPVYGYRQPVQQQPIQQPIQQPVQPIQQQPKQQQPIQPIQQPIQQQPKP